MKETYADKLASCYATRYGATDALLSLLISGLITAEDAKEQQLLVHERYPKPEPAKTEEQP